MAKDKEDLSKRTDSSLIEERTELANKYTSLTNEAKSLVGRLHRLKGELRKRRKERHVPFVSDHAVIRYLERVENLDIEAIREYIQDKIPIDAHINERNGIVLDGFKIKLSKDHKAITTILHEDMLDEGSLQEERSPN